MSQQQRILELVKSGSITVEQGMELLNTLEPNMGNSPNSRNPEMPRSPQPPTPPNRGRPAPHPHEPAARGPRAGRPIGAAGGQLSFDQIVQLGMYGIKPEYVKEMRDAGLEDIDFDTVVQLGMYGIKPNYVLEIRTIAEEMGAPMPSTQKIIELGMYGVKPDYIRGMMSTGLADLGMLSDDSETSGNMRTRLEARIAELQDKRRKLKAKLERTKGGRGHERLLEVLEEVDGEIEDLDEKMGELEVREALADEPEDQPDPSEPASRKWFDINAYVDANLPSAVRRTALQEALGSVQADFEATEDASERAALMEVQKQINEELERLSDA